MVDKNNLSYNGLADDDFEEVVKFIAVNFSVREPLSTMLHLTEEDYEEILPGAFPFWTEGGVSVVVRDGNTNKIVGCIMAAILTPNKTDFFGGVFKAINSKVEYLNNIMEIVESSVNLFRKYDVKSILDICMVTVDPEYAGNGVGKLLVSECERRGLALGCQMATAQATNVSSQSLLGKIGYLTDAEIDYDSLRINGQQVLDKERSLGTFSVKVMARCLVK